MFNYMGFFLKTLCNAEEKNNHKNIQWTVLHKKIVDMHLETYV